MNEKDFRNLLKKQKQKKLSKEEKEFLNTFESTLISKNKGNVFTSDLHKQDLKRSIQNNINQHKKVRRDFKWLNYAASIVVLLCVGVGGVYYRGYFEKDAILVVDTEHITLQLENGTTQIIDEKEETHVVDVKGNIVGEQKGKQLVYGSDVEKETLVYNTLTIPKGKRFELQLSDGSHVHLNAGTSLKYPIKFIKGEKRQVFLKGEAYFNVAKDEEHPFVVNANEINIRVLGTKFNVSSYPEDKQINTVLIEGSVDVYKGEDNYDARTAKNIRPGFKATWQKKESLFTVEDVDTELYTSWMKGRVIFRRVSFENMIKKLERHYNVEIINNNELLNKEEFGASFDVETIEQVFETLNANYNINYTIENNKIIIN